MVATFWQADIAEEHNRRSVVPHLVVEGPYKTQAGSLSLSIMNNGMGPAIITAIDFHLDNKVIVQSGNVNWSQINTAVKEHTCKSITEYPINYHGFQGKLVIPPNEKFELISIDKDDFNEKSVGYAIAVFEYLKPSFCYRSIYGDLFFTKSADIGVIEGSCNLDGAVEVFGSYIRFKAPWSKVITASDVFGE